jgi:hypothetical protein
MDISRQPLELSRPPLSGDPMFHNLAFSVLNAPVITDICFRHRVVTMPTNTDQHGVLVGVVLMAAVVGIAYGVYKQFTTKKLK